jgi:cell division transport system permease protein
LNTEESRMMFKRGIIQMKLRTIKYMIKEGLSNTYKNLLMSLASVSMVIASLLIFGIFLMVIINLTYNLNQIERHLEIVVFLESSATPMEADAIEQKIKNDEKVLNYVRLSKEQAYAGMADLLGDSALLEDLSPEFLFESFRVRLKNPEESAVFTAELDSMEGIEEIEYPKELLEKITLVLQWVNIGSMVVLVLLLIISISIIANTIKLTVYARRREIEIMKYIGANDWFIRWPFIIEGMLIGFIGSITSFVITSYLYNSVADYVNTESLTYGLDTVFRMVPLGIISAQILFVYSFIGIVMGAVGSIISVRKHLNV